MQIESFLKEYEKLKLTKNDLGIESYDGLKNMIFVDELTKYQEDELNRVINFYKGNYNARNIKEFKFVENGTRDITDYINYDNSGKTVGEYFNIIKDDESYERLKIFSLIYERYSSPWCYKMDLLFILLVESFYRHDYDTLYSIISSQHNIVKYFYIKNSSHFNIIFNCFEDALDKGKFIDYYWSNYIIETISSFLDNKYSIKYINKNFSKKFSSYYFLGKLSKIKSIYEFTNFLNNNKFNLVDIIDTNKYYGVLELLNKLKLSEDEKLKDLEKENIKKVFLDYINLKYKKSKNIKKFTRDFNRLNFEVFIKFDINLDDIEDYLELNPSSLYVVYSLKK